MDKEVGIPDAIQTLNYLFLGGELGCPDAADANDDGFVDISDVFTTVFHLFAGKKIPQPNGRDGLDLTYDHWVKGTGWDKYDWNK